VNGVTRPTNPRRTVAELCRRLGPVPATADGRPPVDLPTTPLRIVGPEETDGPQNRAEVDDDAGSGNGQDGAETGDADDGAQDAPRPVGGTVSRAVGGLLGG
jgi:hypothetical protein